MQKASIVVTAAAIAMAFTLSAVGQTTTTAVSRGPGVASAAQRVKIAATVTAIDPATRSVTLKGREGKELTVTAGPEVKNFAQIKVGDRVNAEYVESLTLELKKGSTAPIARTESATRDTANPGDRPAAVVGRQVTIVAEVTDLDVANQTVTLRGPQRTVELKVADPEQFKLVAKGDRVEATYTEAVAIAVEPAKN